MRVSSSRSSSHSCTRRRAGFSRSQIAAVALDKAHTDKLAHEESTRAALGGLVACHRVRPAVSPRVNVAMASSRPRCCSMSFSICAVNPPSQVRCRVRYPARMRYCHQEKELLQAWSEATQIFSEARKELHTTVGTLPQSEYTRLQLEVEQARSKMDNARLALEIHRHEHGC
jgi:hypothetical protein